MQIEKLLKKIADKMSAGFWFKGSYKNFKNGQALMDALLEITKAILDPTGNNLHGRTLFRNIMAEVTSTLHELTFNVQKAIENHPFLLLHGPTAKLFKSDCTKRGVNLNQLLVEAIIRIMLVIKQDGETPQSKKITGFKALTEMLSPPSSTAKARKEAVVQFYKDIRKLMDNNEVARALDEELRTFVAENEGDGPFYIGSPTEQLIRVMFDARLVAKYKPSGSNMDLLKHPIMLQILGLPAVNDFEEQEKELRNTAILLLDQQFPRSAPIFHASTSNLLESMKNPRFVRGFTTHWDPDLESPVESSPDDSEYSKMLSLDEFSSGKRKPGMSMNAAFKLDSCKLAYKYR